MSKFFLTIIMIFIVLSCNSQDNTEKNKATRDLMSIDVKGLLTMCKEAVQKSRQSIQKWEKCKFFEFKTFSLIQDTSVWYIDYVNVGFDKKGNILEIDTYGDIKKSRMNYNLYFYPLDSQFEIIWVNQYGPGGNEASVKDLKEEWKQYAVQTLIIHDKIKKNSIYFRTYPNIDFRKSNYKYYFFKEIGVLDMDFMVTHKFKFNFNGGGGANQITSYRGYQSLKGLNIEKKKYVYDDDKTEYKKKVFCTIETTMNDLLNEVSLWEKNNQIVEESIENEECCLHIPAYLPPR